MPIQDRSHNLTQFEFEVTHRCNKNCKHCSHRISTSDYELTLDDYHYVVKQIIKKQLYYENKFRSVFLIGGEPLCHPDYEQLLWNVCYDFPYAEIIIQTNGKLLPEYYNDRITWQLSEYPGWNDDIVAEYESKPNVKVYRFDGMFWDISDPHLSDSDAKEARANCLFLCRVIGRNLYDCCLSEGIERTFKTEPVHVPFTENWRDEIRTIETWRACKHCFRAKTILEYMKQESGKMYGERTRSHDE